MWIKLGIAAAVAVALIIGWNLEDEFDEESVRGKRVFVTGASTGIGEQLAYQFCRLGADVVITARREGLLKQVVEKCKQLGRPDGKYHYLKADMSDLNSTRALIKEAIKFLGGLDYLVLNHIVNNHYERWVGSPQNFNRLHITIEVNFMAYVYLATHALPELEKSEGRVVIVNSMLGKVSHPYIGCYSASKFALDGFFGSLRQQLILEESPVSVTSAVIGLVGTENALGCLRDFGLGKLLDKVTPEPPTEAARAILVAGATRQREVYFPYWPMRLLTLFRDWFPETLGKQFRDMYRSHDKT